MDLAPIAFFAYNRPEHTLKALTSLAQCELADQSHLYIFCDGPKTKREIDKVLKVHEIVGGRQWCGTVDLIRRETNLGLANSIISGTTRLCEQYGRAIILEDDLLLAPYFLYYMNGALAKYQPAEQVMQISGYMFPVTLTADYDAVFLPFTTTWGWATWQRAWRHFDPQMSGYEALKQDQDLRHKFDLYGAYPYFDMLEQQVAGKIDSWGIRWYLSTFLLGGLTLHPLKSLVQNFGFDASGTHAGVSTIYDCSGLFKESILRFPEPHMDTACFDQLLYYLRGQRASNRKSPWTLLKKLKFWCSHVVIQKI
jgi:hypothetical protein